MINKTLGKWTVFPLGLAHFCFADKFSQLEILYLVFFSFFGKGKCVFFFSSFFFFRWTSKRRTTHGVQKQNNFFLCVWLKVGHLFFFHFPLVFVGLRTPRPFFCTENRRETESDQNVVALRKKNLSIVSDVYGGLTWLTKKKILGSVLPDRIQNIRLICTQNQLFFLLPVRFFFCFHGLIKNTFWCRYTGLKAQQRPFFFVSPEWKEIVAVQRSLVDCVCVRDTNAFFFSSC